jgi:hypothetical protein
MNELKDVFIELLDGQVPPMASAEEMLAVAQRGEHRRRAGMAAVGAGLAGLVLVGAFAAVTSRGQSPPVLQPGATAGSSAPATTASPANTAAVSGGADILDAVAAALPSGYTIRHSKAGSDVRIDDRSDVGAGRPGAGLDGVRSLSADAIVYAGNRAGEFDVSITDSRHAKDPAKAHEQPTGDLCATEVFPSKEDTGSCRTITAGGVPIRYGTGHLYPDHPGIVCMFATRFVAGAQVTATQCLGVVTFVPSAVPAGLATPPLTDQQLARFAADPAFLG